MDLQPIKMLIQHRVKIGELANEEEGIAEIMAYLNRHAINKALKTSQEQIKIDQYQSLDSFIKAEVDQLDLKKPR